MVFVKWKTHPSSTHVFPALASLHSGRPDRSRTPESLEQTAKHREAGRATRPAAHRQRCVLFVRTPSELRVRRRRQAPGQKGRPSLHGARHLSQSSGRTVNALARGQQPSGTGWRLEQGDGKPVGLSHGLVSWPWVAAPRTEGFGQEPPTLLVSDWRDGADLV